MQIVLKNVSNNNNDDNFYDYHKISHKKLSKNRQSNQPGSPLAKLSIDFENTVTVSLAKMIITKFNEKSPGIKVFDYSIKDNSILALAGLFGKTPTGRFSNSIRKALKRTVNSNKFKIRKIIMPSSKLTSLNDYLKAFYKLMSKFISNLLKCQNDSKNSSSADSLTASKANCSNRASNAASASVSPSTTSVLNLYGTYYLNSIVSDVRALNRRFSTLSTSARSCSSAAESIKGHQIWLSASNSHSAYVSASAAILNAKISCDNETRDGISYVCSTGDSMAAIRAKRNSELISKANKKLSAASSSVTNANNSLASADKSISDKSFYNSEFNRHYINSLANTECSLSDFRIDFKTAVECACDNLGVTYSKNDNLQDLTTNFYIGLTDFFSRLRPIRRLVAEELYRLNPNLDHPGLPAQTFYYGLASGRYVERIRNRKGQIRQVSGVKLLVHEIHEFAKNRSASRTHSTQNDNFDNDVLNNIDDFGDDNQSGKGGDNKGPDGPEL